MRGMLARAAVGATFVATTGAMVAVALPADAASGGSGGANRASRTPASSTGLSDSAARSRTRAAFPDFVDEKGWADLQDEPGTDVQSYLGDKAAVINAGGRKALVSSLLPLRSGQGDLKRPIDTDLSEQAGRLRPAQPLSEYSVAPTLGTGSLIDFPNSGVKLSLDDTDVRRESRGTRDGEALVFANARRDSDALIKSLPDGAQVAFSIRGPSSPKTYRLAVTSRSGDELAATSPQATGARKGPVGGVVLLRDGRVVTSITAPVAIDANGKNLPVQTDVRDRRISYHVELGADTAFPALLDPFVVEDQRYWFGQPPAPTPPSPNPVPDFGGWSFSASPALLGGTAGVGTFGNGLNIFGSANIIYPSGGVIGNWIYQAPYVAGPFESEGTRIVKADFGYTAHVRSQPFGSAMIESIWNRQAGRPETTGMFRGADFNAAYTPYVQPFGVLLQNSEGIAGNKASYPYRVHCLSVCNAATPTGSLGLGSPGNQARFSLFQQAGKPSIAGGAFMGSSLIILTEQAAPRLTISGTSATLTSTPADISVTSNDYGVGPSTLEAFLPGDTTPVASASQGAPCVGAGVASPQGNNTPGSANSGDRNHRCTAPLNVTVPADALPDGAYNLTFKSTDIIGNTVTETRAVNIDRTGPDVTLGGTLGDALGGAITATSAAITYQAEDAAAGLASLVLSIDGTTVVNAITPQTAAAGSYTADLAALAAGAHTVTVNVADAVGNTEIETYIFKIVHRPSGGSRTVDVDAQNALTIVGGAPGDHAGASIASIGDVNRDGISDFAVGAPTADPSLLKADAGIVYIVYGRSQGGTINLSQFGSADGYRILGANLSDATGTAVSAAGDLNGDGTNDLLIGAPRMGLLAINQPGAVWAVFLPSSAAGATDLDLANPGSRAFRVDGPARLLSIPGVTTNFQHPFGTVLSSVVPNDGGSSDVNNDGFDDFVIGSPEETTSGVGEAGQAFVIYGKSSTGAVSVSSLSSGAGITVTGAQTGDALGSAVAITEGDRQSTGPQVIVGAPGTDANGITDSGRLYELRSGALSSPAVSVGSLESSSGAIDGPGGGARLGSTIAPLTDINNDDVADYALGGTTVAVVYGDEIPGARRVADTPGYRITATTAQYGGEKTVAPQADVDGDNLPDLLVGQAGGNSASSWSLYSRPAGGDLDLANLPASAGTRLSDPAAATAVIADAGDLFQDGNEQYAIGSPNWNNGLLGVEAGRVRIGQTLDADSCQDDEPTLTTQTHTFMCDSLGVESVDGALTKPASLAGGTAARGAQASAASSMGRVKIGRLYGKTRHVWRNPKVIATYTVGNLAFHYEGQVQYDQFLRLNDGDLSQPNPALQYTQWTQSIRRLKGDEIKARLSFACRIDITDDSDKPCTPSQEDSSACKSPDFSDFWWRQPQATGGFPACGYAGSPLSDVRRGHAFVEGNPNTTARYFYRANIFFTPEQPAHRNPFEPSGGQYSLPASGGPRGIKEYQTYRFRCGKVSSVPGRVRCLFDTASQTTKG